MKPGSRFLSLFYLVFSFLVLQCSTAGVFTPIGFALYKNVKEPVLLGPSNADSKFGEACAYNFAGLYVSGDYSTRKAMENASIKKVSTVDRHIHSFITLFAKVCTQVTGE